EAIVCLTGPCSNPNMAGPAASDPVQEVKQSEAEELQIALRTNSVDALYAYLSKYPDADKRPEVLGTISRMRRAEFTEWTLYEVGINDSRQRFPQFMRLNSIHPFADKVAVQVRLLIDPTAFPTKYPESSYAENL